MAAEHCLILVNALAVCFISVKSDLAICFCFLVIPDWYHKKITYSKPCESGMLTRAELLIFKKPCNILRSARFYALNTLEKSDFTLYEIA